jgi:hypothetical protein
MCVIDELTIQGRMRDSHLPFEGFLEALVRISLLKVLPTDQEIEDYGARDAGMFYKMLRHNVCTIRSDSGVEIPCTARARTLLADVAASWLTWPSLWPDVAVSMASRGRLSGLMWPSLWPDVAVSWLTWPPLWPDVAVSWLTWPPLWPDVAVSMA